VFSARRRDELAFFREDVRPFGERSVFRLRVSENALSFFGFVPETRGSFDRFAARAVPLLAEAAPVVDLAQKMFRQQWGREGALSRALSLEHKLTLAEHDTMELVMRGLTNPEIAGVQRISQNTVRNRLAACYRKLRVTTRTEAVYMLSLPPELASGPLTPFDTYQTILCARRRSIARGGPAIVIV
jgi:DNA-binding CsgD family transcriptional regulator